MKSNFKKIISLFIIAAAVISSGFTTITKPTPSTDNSIVIIEIDPDSDDDKNCNEVNDTDPPFDDPEVEILQ